MIFEKFKRLETDRTVKAMIGMSREKFDQLAILFADAYAAIQQERLQQKAIKRLPSGGSQGMLDSHEKRLFFILFYLKTYPTFDVLGFHFDLSAGHAHDYVKEFMPVLKRALEQVNAFPKRTFKTVKDFQQAIDKYANVLIDGMEIPCVRPSHDVTQTDRYSGKKNAIP